MELTTAAKKEGDDDDDLRHRSLVSSLLRSLLETLETWF
jgi:hypothetical protein